MPSKESLDAEKLAKIKAEEKKERLREKRKRRRLRKLEEKRQQEEVRISLTGKVILLSAQPREEWELVNRLNILW